MITMFNIKRTLEQKRERLINYTQNRLNGWYENAKEDYGIDGWAKIEYLPHLNKVVIKGVEEGKKTYFEMNFYDEYLDSQELRWAYDYWSDCYKILD